MPQPLENAWDVNGKLRFHAMEQTIVIRLQWVPEEMVEACGYHFRHACRNVEMEWQIETEKIRTRSSLAQGEFSWELFVRMVRTLKGVLTHLTDRILYWLPRSCFASETEFERLVVLSKTKIPKHYEVH